MQQGGDGAAVQHLLSSCYCPLAAVELALCEAAKQGHTEGARLLLAAGAAPCAQPAGVGKSALHAAAEAGHEAVARLLVRAAPQAIHARSETLGGRTPLQVARDADLAGLARRVEEYARECEEGRTTNG